MVYHSAFNNAQGAQQVCGCYVLPLRTETRGPAPIFDGEEKDRDIVEEALFFFKANLFFRNFEVQGPADRVLIYLTLFIQKCIKEMEKVKTKADGQKILHSLTAGDFPVPGESNFPLGGIVPAPKGTDEQNTFRAYFKQLREETAKRLIDRVFLPDGSPDKFWMCFSKKKFLNKTL